MRNNFRRRRKKKLKTKQILLIIILFLFAISASYAMFSTQLFINGTVTGQQEQFSVVYINMENSSTYPPSIGYMSTYSYTFAIPPVIQSITMGGTPLVANTDYTYTNGTLTIPNVTGSLVIQGDDDAQNVNVTFDNDGVTNTVTVKQGQTVNKPQDPVKSGYGFLGWADANDVYFDFTTPIMTDITLYAKWMQGVVAEINGTYYQTLQAAIADVPTNNTETTINILTNISENNVIAQGKNIVLNIQGFTIENNNEEVCFENNGTIKIISGTIQTSGKNSSINNNATGHIIITGGTLKATGQKSVIYNLGGTIHISGDAYLSSETNGNYNNRERGTIQNLSNGSLTITGGKIEGKKGLAISSDGTFILGTGGDGIVSKTNPVIIGKDYGIRNYQTLKFYDGIVKGKTAGFNGEASISEIEGGYNISHSTEVIDNITYKTAYLEILRTVTFNANGGTVSETERLVEDGTKIGTLPLPTRTGYAFEGWYTSAEGGTEVTADTIITQDMHVYAHWGDVYVAKIGETKYETIQSAVTAAPANTQTTITLLKNVVLSERITITGSKNIVLDIQNFTLSQAAVIPIIDNYGTLSISNGTITTSTSQGAINNKQGGVLNISGGRIIATGTRQAIYNEGGTTTISGSAYLSAVTTERATVQNHIGTVNIIGGTIISSGSSAVVNEAGRTMNIGTKDGNISTSSPIIQGIDYGISNDGTLKFYDGTIKGITDAFSNLPNDLETNSQIVNGTEQIDGETYKTAHLEISP